MRDIPGYPDPHAMVLDPAKSVTLRGSQRDVDHVKVTRSLGTGLPALVPGASGMVAATGDVTWSTEGLVTEGWTLPWGDPKMPAKQDSVNIALGIETVDGPVTARTLTGVVDSLSGSAREGRVSTSVVDRVDRLRKRIDIDPLWYRHPAPSQGDAPMAIGLHPSYVTDRVARRCGYYATPPMHDGAVVSVPMMGSTWPERATLTRAAGNGMDYPVYRSAPWGLTVANMDATYRPYLPPGVTGSLDSPMFVRFLLSDGLSDGAVRITCEWPGGSQWVVRLSASMLMVEMYNTQGLAHRWVTTLPTISDGETDVQVWIDGASIIRARFDDGPELQSPQMTPAAEMYTQPIASVRVQTAGVSSTGMGGLQVGFQPTRSDLSQWERSALIETVPYGELFWVPAIIDRDCLDLLKEQATAEMAAIWLDEDGRLRYRHRDVLLNAEHSEDLTFDHVEDLPWDESWDSVASQVDVSFRRPVSKQGRYQTITAWQGSGETLDVGEVWEEILHPEGDGDWIGVDTSMAILDNAAAVDVHNSGRTSFIGGVIEVDGEVYSNATAFHFTHTLTKLDARSYLLRIETHNYGTDRGLAQRTSQNNTTMFPSKRSFDLPILRCNSAITASEETVSGVPIGPATAAVHSHDAGWWVQRTIDAQRIADYLARYMSVPRPLIRDVTVTTVDDRRQLGDVVLVPLGEDRPTLRMLRTALTDDYGTDGRTQTMTLQTIAEET